MYKATYEEEVQEESLVRNLANFSRFVDSLKFALEVKISKDISRKDLKGLIAFKEENPETQAYLICLEKESRLINLDSDIKVNIVNDEEFLEMLWNGLIF